MKVKQFMRKNPVYVKQTATIRDVVRLIFNLHISAVMVCKNGKLMGIVTEEDILHRLFPSVRDFMEGYVDDEIGSYVDERLHNLMNKPVTSIMTKKIMTVDPEAELMSAQSKMLINEFSHLPIVDKNNKLLGIISQGDVFKALVGEEVPYESEGQYHDWMADMYDLAYGRPERYQVEAKSLEELFKKKKIARIADLGCGTGGHAIELAKVGIETDGYDLSKRMISKFQSKIRTMSPPIARRIKPVHVTGYQEGLNAVHEPYDAVIFMGNALAHMGKNYKKVLKTAASKLSKKGTIVIMMSDFEHTLRNKNRLQHWDIVESPTAKNKEYAFALFFDPPEPNSKLMNISTAILSNSGNRWKLASINTSKMYMLKKDEVVEDLQKLGFVNFSIYGSMLDEPLFKNAYNSENAYWITIVASR